MQLTVCRGPRAPSESTYSLLLPPELIFPIKSVSCTTLGAVVVQWPTTGAIANHLEGCSKAFARMLAGLDAPFACYHLIRSFSVALALALQLLKQCGAIYARPRVDLKSAQRLLWHSI